MAVSVQSLINTLEKIHLLNESLLELSNKKTDIVKKGNFEALVELTANEQKHIQAIEQLEQQRENLVQAIVQTKDGHAATLSECIETVKGNEQLKLMDLKDKLSNVLLKIRERNQLNEQLIQQSMQFVQVSINLLRPQPDQVTYGPPKGKKSSGETDANSIFNSKA